MTKKHLVGVYEAHKSLKPYMTYLQFERYQILRDALEKVGFDPENFGKLENREAFKKALEDRIIKTLVEKKGLKGDFTREEVLRQGETLLGISHKVLNDIVEDQGADVTVNELMEKIEKMGAEFVQKHYVEIADKYIREEKHIKPTLEYMGVSPDDVYMERITLPVVRQYLVKFGMNDYAGKTIDVTDLVLPEHLKPVTERKKRKGIEKLVAEGKKEIEEEKKKNRNAPQPST